MSSQLLRTKHTTGDSEESLKNSILQSQKRQDLPNLFQGPGTATEKACKQA